MNVYRNDGKSSVSVLLCPGGLQGRAGEYSAGEMAAVGASLAVVLVLCLIGIGVMAHRIKGHNADWKKLSEASIFRSTVSFPSL